MASIPSGKNLIVSHDGDAVLTKSGMTITVSNVQSELVSVTMKLESAGTGGGGGGADVQRTVDDVAADGLPDNEASTVSAASASSTYQQGIDDFYQSQAENQKKKLDTIHEYLLYIMSPLIYEEDMDEFCTKYIL